METQAKDIYLSLGLRDGVDTSMNTLLHLWDEMQSLSMEAGQAPDSNLFTFAETCVFFAVIMRRVNEADDDDLDMETTDLYDGPDSRARIEEWEDSHNPKRSPSPAPESYSEDDFSNTEPHQSESIESSNDFGVRDSGDGIKVEQTTSLSLQDFPVGLFPSSKKSKAESTAQKFPMKYFRKVRRQPAIGFVFFLETPNINRPAGEVNIGIIIRRRYRGRGYARQAAELVLKVIFETFHYHRVQAALLDSYTKDRAFSLFTQLGFGHEGIRRRSSFCASDGTWKDVTYLAMLDTEWVMRGFLKRAPKSMWDELFLRHDRERQELLRWEDAKALKRSSSVETITRGSLKKSKLQPDGGDVEGCHDEFTSIEGDLSLDITPPSSESGDDDLYVPYPTSNFVTGDMRYRDADTESSSSVSDAESGDTSESGSSSQWDVLDSSSEVTSSSFEELHESDHRF